MDSAQASRVIAASFLGRFPLGGIGGPERGRGKSELHRAMCSLTARAGGGLSPRRHVRLRYGKCHRKHTTRFSPVQRDGGPGKGEKVR